MARPTLGEVIAAGKVLVCDGAMGTQLMARGMKAGECPELWNIQHGPDVQSIHAAYIAAGCDLVTTNTFGGTRTALGKHGFESRVAELNKAGAALAKAAAGDKAYVLGDVGPFGDFLEPAGDFTSEQLADIFGQQIAALKAGGADGIIIETMADPAEVAIAIAAARKVDAKWPVIATFTFSASAGTFKTMMGTPSDRAMHMAIDAGATAVGTNCGTGLSLDDYLALAKQLLKAAGKTPVIVQPNAGAPHSTPEGVKYLALPEDMAKLATAMKAAGVKILGGCCGTSPDHLRAIAAAKV